jgi:two-component system, NtrC family, sensor kinase
VEILKYCVSICLLVNIFISPPLFSETISYKYYNKSIGKPILQIDDAFQTTKLDEYLNIITTDDANVEFPDLLASGEFSVPPESLSGKKLSFGYNNQTYFFYFRIHDTRKIRDELYLTLDYPPLDTLVLTCLDAKGEISLLQKSGDHTPFQDWPVKYRKPSFFLDTDIRECYLKANSSSSLQFALELNSLIHFNETNLKDYVTQSIYFGAIICMIVYNLFLGTSVRLSMYFYYTGFLISVALYQLSLLGLGFTLMWNKASIFWIDYSIVYFLLSGSLCINLFFLKLLNIKDVLHKFNKMGIFLNSSIVFTIVISHLFSYSTSIRIGIVLLFLTIIYVLAGAVYLSFKKNKMAIIYLTAWIVLLIGILSFIFVSQGIMERNFLSVYGSQIGSVIEFIVLSLAMGYRLNLLQEKTAEDLKRIIQEKESLLSQEQERVEKQAELMRQLEREKENAKSAYFQLEASQKKLIQSDKMITLGTMVAGIAHEINTPLGAIKANSENIQKNMEDLLALLHPNQKELSQEHLEIVLQMRILSQNMNKSLSTKEIRALKKKVLAYLEEKNIHDAEEISEMILDLTLGEKLDLLEKYLVHPDIQSILKLVSTISGVNKKSSVIGLAADKVSKIVKSLKSFMHTDQKEEKVLANIIDGMETVLTILHSKLKSGVEVVTQYEEIPQIYCYPDELNQIWTNLIHNSIQAMDGQGTIKIEIKMNVEKDPKPDIDKRDPAYIGDYISISIEDNGPGIPTEIRSKIFEAFFTTKAVGEGSGLGLHIIGKILEKHNGYLELASVPGMTKFSIKIPALVERL